MAQFAAARSLEERIPLAFDDVDRVGDDLRVRARVARRTSADVHGHRAGGGPHRRRGPGAGGGEAASSTPGSLPLDDVAIGDSIAVNGCCLTVVGIERGAGTRGWRSTCPAKRCAAPPASTRRGPVNLEKALRLADRLGGHLVTGHVDGVGTVVANDAAGEGAEAAGAWWSTRPPRSLASSPPRDRSPSRA